MPSQRFLKALVAVLGVAIIVALGFVVYGVARLGVSKPAPVAAPTTPAGGFDVLDLGQPVGTEVAGAVALPDGKLAVTLRGGAIPDRIVVVDPAAGRVVGTIHTARP